MQLTTGFVELLDEFVTVFNAPTFLLFVDLMTGWTLSHRHRFVTDLILSAGVVGKGHFANSIGPLGANRRTSRSTRQRMCFSAPLAFPQRK